MSEFDERVRRSLQQQGDLINDAPAPAELTDKIVRKERRARRGLTVALVVALLAGPTLGFVAGRGRPEEAHKVTRTAAAKTESNVVIHDDKVPTIPGAAALSGASGSLSSPVTDATKVAASTQGIIVAGDVWAGGYGAKLARFFDRDAGNAKVRAYHAEVETPLSSGPPWWEPADYCFPNGIVQADVSTNDMVGIVSSSVYASYKDTSLGGSLGVAGVSEQAPHWIAIAQSTAGVATIRVTFPGGSTDEMKPVDGVAVLVAPAQVTEDQLMNDVGSLKAHVQSLDGSGAVVAEADLTLYGSAYAGMGDAGCNAPQVLPASGTEQPADPVAARAEIASHFGGPAGAKKVSDILANLDDPRGMEDVWNELVNGPFGAEAKAAETQFRDLVFLDATHAAVQYDVHIPNYTDFTNRFAEYVLVDGTWKETRESLCRDIALAGVTCPPPE